MTDFFVVDDIDVELRINRRRRSRIGISISPSGHVVLDAPPSTHKDEVINQVQEHRRWLRHRLVRTPRFSCICPSGTHTQGPYWE